MSTYSYEISFTFDFATSVNTAWDLGYPWMALGREPVEGWIYTDAGLMSTGGGGPWVDPTPGYARYGGPIDDDCTYKVTGEYWAGEIPYSVGGSWSMRFIIGFESGGSTALWTLFIDDVAVFTDYEWSADPLSHEMWIDTSNLTGGVIESVSYSSDLDGSATLDYENDNGFEWVIRVDVDAPTVVQLRGPRVIRFANGVEMVSRSGSVWRRLSAEHAWAAARTATDTAPVILPSIARVGNAVCLDTAAVQSASGGTGWTTSPPASVLPTDVAGWPRGADGVRDLLVSEANGKALGVSVEAGALKAYLQGQTTVTLASLGTATVGGPVPSRDSQGRWYVGALVDGTWREWRTGSSWSSWTELSAQSLGTTAAWSTACLWVGRNGLQLLAGYHKTAGKVRAMWRTGYAAAWSSPADIATVAVDTAPYAVQTTTGQWEIGWRTATAWVLYRAETPGGTWTVVA